MENRQQAEAGLPDSGKFPGWGPKLSLSGTGPLSPLPLLFTLGQDQALRKGELPQQRTPPRHSRPQWPRSERGRPVGGCFLKPHSGTFLGLWLQLGSLLPDVQWNGPELTSDWLFATRVGTTSSNSSSGEDFNNR